MRRCRFARKERPAASPGSSPSSTQRQRLRERDAVVVERIPKIGMRDKLGDVERGQLSEGPLELGHTGVTGESRRQHETLGFPHRGMDLGRHGALMRPARNRRDEPSLSRSPPVTRSRVVDSIETDSRREAEESRDGPRPSQPTFSRSEITHGRPCAVRRSQPVAWQVSVLAQEHKPISIPHDDAVFLCRRLHFIKKRTPQMGSPRGLVDFCIGNAAYVSVTENLPQPSCGFLCRR